MTDAVDSVGCWRRIGVWGNQKSRCDELERVIHCRNCDVFAQAAREVFERRLQDLSPVATQAVDAIPDRAKGDGACLPFRVGNIWLGLPTSSVVAIADRAPTHSIPHRQDDVVQGLVPVNGEIVIAISLLALMAQGQAVPSELATRGVYARRVVMAARGRRVAFDVDEVRGVQRFFRVQLSDPSRYCDPVLASLVEGMIELDGAAGQMAGVLDMRAFLDALDRVLV